MSAPKEEASDWLADLEAKFMAEDREDRRAARAQRRARLPESERDVRTFDGFAHGPGAPGET